MVVIWDGREEKEGSCSVRINVSIEIKLVSLLPSYTKSSFTCCRRNWKGKE